MTTTGTGGGTELFRTARDVLLRHRATTTATSRYVGRADDVLKAPGSGGIPFRMRLAA
ncbi:hypothetical protein OG453_30580 [Streptomyces sp. NBC_01381]|uniref:hypothetical protein n=1 Tax=Streptomyces sp. NBC_01381 TaxID=2903845 RepID=UPI0022591C1E|nr:hypothetical protein [Streptomyces sp. NBC_01381]MCX4670991.1 hypothetical protein [Streptomyces sp. NBC_01381]